MNTVQIDLDGGQFESYLSVVKIELAFTSRPKSESIVMTKTSNLVERAVDRAGSMLLLAISVATAVAVVGIQL